jgi:phospholipase/carboxylesterase
MPLGEGEKVIIALHGRGGNAADILQLAAAVGDESCTLLAPQATGFSWYPYSFLAPPAQNEPSLSSALSIVKQTYDHVVANGITPEKVFLLGFSQGACLTLEFAARHARRYGGVIAFTGGLIGDRIYPENYKGDFEGTSFYIGSSDVDPHVPLPRIYASENILRDMGASIQTDIFPGMGHTINEQEMAAARKILSS